MKSYKVLILLIIIVLIIIITVETTKKIYENDISYHYNKIEVERENNIKSYDDVFKNIFEANPNIIHS